MKPVVRCPPWRSMSATSRSAARGAQGLRQQVEGEREQVGGLRVALDVGVVAHEGAVEGVA